MDALWLGVVARNFYMSRIGDLILDQPRWGVAALFYLVYIVGRRLFRDLHGTGTEQLEAAAGYGALFGLFTYMTYNFTNLAVMRGFDTTVASSIRAGARSVGAIWPAGTRLHHERLGWVSAEPSGPDHLAGRRCTPVMRYRPSGCSSSV